MAKKPKKSAIGKDDIPLFPGMDVVEAKAVVDQAVQLARTEKAQAEAGAAAKPVIQPLTAELNKEGRGASLKEIVKTGLTRVTVPLGERSYFIDIGAGSLGQLGQFWARRPALGKRVVVISNPQISKLYGNTVKKSLEEAGCAVETINIASGETYKSLETAARIYEALLNFKMDRSSVILALGGGVVGDLAGFVAATFMRGINLVQAPTSLLAQVDSSVGGKTAVNHPKGKNLIGVFYQPKYVLIDVTTLKTLPESERRNGLAEVVKYGMIASEEFFGYLEKHSLILAAARIGEKDGWGIWREVVGRCCEIKARVVGRDEREESGLRAVLNFGHTVGHGIEAATGYKKYKHGEAVALGMLVATSIASHLGMIRDNVYRRLFDLLKKVGLTTVIVDVTPESVIRYMEHDKKVREGKLRFVLPARIGQMVLRDDVPAEVVFRSLQEHSHSRK